MIACIGIATVHSATHGVSSTVNYTLRHAAWVGVGLIFLFIAVLIDYQLLVRFAYPLYAVSLGLLALVLVFGKTVGGAQRWLTLGGFTFQPSELVKLMLILALAKFFNDREGQVKDVKCLIIASILVLVPMALVIQQPDLGTALLFMPILFTLVCIAGVPSKYLAKMTGLGLAVLPSFWFILKDYQKDRLLVFWNPDIDPLGAGYSINQSRIAIGSGGIFGKGWLAGTQTQLRFLPENRTDFIFSGIGEEFGFVGVLFLLGLYAFIVMRGIRIAKESKDVGGSLIAAGVSAMLVLHVFINVGMATGILPVVGMPLPLVSYGGSATVSTLAAIGLLINIRIRRFMF